MEKGRKAWFKIKKTIGLNNPCNLLEKLFDSLVAPITLYGCEVWGPYCNLMDTDTFEHLHIKFIKEILGVHSKATNVACLAELNRYPLREKIKLSTLKFLDHISNSKNSLAYKIFNNLPPNNPWITATKKWVGELGFSYVINNETIISKNIRNFKQRIYDQALQNRNSCLANCNKLSFYNHIHKFNKRPFYVDICKFKSDRSIICKYRISAHSLSIERGRYKNIPKGERICKKCNASQIEDEMHFFIHCPSYRTYRTELIQKVNSTLKNFKVLNENNIINILNSNSKIILKAVIDYINKCQESS